MGALQSSPRELLNINPDVPQPPTAAEGESVEENGASNGIKKRRNSQIEVQPKKKQKLATIIEEPCPKISEQGQSSVTNGIEPVVPTPVPPPPTVPKPPLKIRLKLRIRFQQEPCTSQTYAAYPMCLPCTLRKRNQQNDEESPEDCYFYNVRSFSWKNAKIEDGPFFQTLPEEAVRPIFNPLTNFLSSPSNRTIQEIKTTCAKTLDSFLQRDLDLLLEMYESARSGPPVVEKPQPLEYRFNCDVCATTIITAYYFCKFCGKSLCVDCKRRLSGSQTDFKVRKKRGRTPSIHHHQKTEDGYDQTMTMLQSCLPDQSHDESCLLPFTCMSLLEMRNLQTEITDYLFSVNSLGVGLSALHLPPSIETVSSKDGITQPYYLMRNKEFKLKDFRQLWDVRPTAPVVVEGIKFGENWTMRELSDLYGDEECTILDTQTEEEWDGLLRDVLEEMHKPKRVAGKIMRVKDWPKERFERALPELYKELKELLPAPDYTRDQGSLNLLSYLPSNSIIPDIGARFDFALGSTNTVGTKGTSKLRIDGADELNVMVYALPLDETNRTTVWDIFPAEETPKIQAYLRTLQGQQWGITAQMAETLLDDPILSVEFFLDPAMLKELDEKYHVKRYRIYQRPGDAIFVPAGYPRQWCNLSNSASIITDFLSPGSLTALLTNTMRLREQTKDGSTLEDILSAKSLCYWVYKACQHYEKIREDEDRDST